MKKFRFIIGWIMIICTVNLSAQTVNGMQFCIYKLRKECNLLEMSVG